MKNAIRILLIFCCTLIMSCDKNPINGKLDGFWQLTKIDTISGGTKTTKELGIYYSFQLNLMGVSCSKGSYSSYIMRFSNADSKLTITNCYDPNNSVDTLIMDYQVLKPYGINKIPSTFEIDKNTNKELILSDSKLRLYFTKR